MRYMKRAISSQIKALERVAKNKEEQAAAAYWRNWYNVGLENLKDAEPQAVNFATTTSQPEGAK
jgi:hypothetical protein